MTRDRLDPWFAEAKEILLGHAPWEECGRTVFVNDRGVPLQLPMKGFG